MKPLNFNKNSWHFKLVSKFNLYEVPYKYDIHGDGSEFHVLGDSADICTYSKRVAFALFLVGIGIAGFTFASMLVIHSLLGIYFSILINRWIFTDLGEVGIIIVGIFVLTVSFHLLIQKISDYRENNICTSKQDTFVDNAFKAWKNKFCVPINFNE